MEDLKTVYHKGLTGHGIEEGTKITFEMYGRDKRKLDMYCKLLILSSIFGSMGSRSRKGLGSFKIVTLSGDTDTKYTDWLRKEPLEILNLIKNHLTDNFKLREFKTSDEAITFNPYREKLLNFPYAKTLYIFKLAVSLDYDVLYNISQLTHDRMIFKNKDNSDVDKGVLGLAKPRFTSPIWISFYSVNGNNYMIVKELNHDYMIFQNNENNKKYIAAYINDLKKIGGGTWQSYSE